MLWPCPVLCDTARAVGSRPWTPGALCRAPTSCSPTRGWPTPSGSSAGPWSKQPWPARRTRRGPGRSRRTGWPTPRLPRCRPARPAHPGHQRDRGAAHTNLGRAPLSAAATDALLAAAAARTWSTTWPAGPAAAAAGARWLPWPPRYPPPRRYTWSTTTPPRWCSRPPRWPPGGRSSSAGARWWRRRRVPATGSAGVDRGAAARGRHDQPDDDRRLPGRGRRADGLRAQGPPI